MRPTMLRTTVIVSEAGFPGQVKIFEVDEKAGVAIVIAVTTDENINPNHS
jgi:hypothetical protein